MQRGGVIEVINHRHFVVKGVVFRQVANPLLDCFALCVDIQTINLNGTASGFQEAGQHFS